MTPATLNGILTFLKQAEALKHTLRSGFLSDGRAESTAEHSWRLCLMAMLVAQDYPDMDALKLIKICLVHDLGEAIGGDIPATQQVAGRNKSADERADLLTLTALLPEAMRATKLKPACSTRRVKTRLILIMGLIWAMASATPSSTKLRVPCAPRLTPTRSVLPKRMEPCPHDGALH